MESTTFSPRQIKYAQPVGGDPAKTFEQSFASLSYTYLQEKAPALLDYLIGFQLVDRNQDETRAAGVFGFDIDGKVIFVPMFFLNKDLKGHEMMYLKDEDLFVPLKESWVNFLISNTDGSLGDPEELGLSELNTQNPDLRSFSQLPEFGKFGEDLGRRQRPKVASWAEPFMPVMAALMVRNCYHLQKYAGLSERLKERGSLYKDPQVLASCWDWYQSYPTFRRNFDKYAGREELVKAAQDLKAALQKQADVLAGKLPRPLRTKQAAAQIRIRIYTEQMVVPAEGADEMDPILDTLSDTDKEQLVREGFVIKDERESAEEFSEAYDIQAPQHYTNPERSGFHEVMFKPCEPRMCYVATKVYSQKGSYTGKVLVYDPDSRRPILADHDQVLIWQDERGPMTSQQQQTRFADLPNATPQANEYYIAVTPCGEALAKFFIKERLGEDTYDIHFSDYVEAPCDPVLAINNYENQDTYYHPLTLCLEGEGSQIVRLRGKFVLPSGTKLLRCPSDYDYADSGHTCSVLDEQVQRESRPRHHGQLATLQDIQHRIHKKLASLKIISNRDELLINDACFSKQAALFHLVKDVGLRESRARDLIKEAERKKACRFYLKLANPFSDLSAAGEGPGASVEFPDPNRGAVADAYVDVPTVQTETLDNVISELEASNTDSDIYHPMMNLEPPSELDWPTDLEQVPQEDVFDTLFLSNMLQASRKDNLVKRWLPDLTKALDRLARLLVNMWWHSEEFEKWYGKTDISDMEDGLLNVFEGLGDLILSFQQKEVNPLGEVSDVLSPDVSTVAEN